MEIIGIIMVVFSWIASLQALIFFGVIAEIMFSLALFVFIVASFS
jgi:hypothetical protein